MLGKMVKNLIKSLIIVMFLSVVISFIFSGFNLNKTYVFGYKFASIQTDSMEPTLMVGDSVIIKYIKPTSIKNGDILAYEHKFKNDRKIVIIHKVYEIGDNYFITKGDNNDVPDTWIVKHKEVIGIVVSKF